MKKIIISFLLCLSFSCFAKEDNSVSIDTICSSTECYKVIRQIGRGAFGNVLEVENEAGEKFAIKSYKNGMSDLFYASPEREFLRGQTLDHPNIVKTIDLFTYNLPYEHEFVYLVLQFVDGNPLGEMPRGALSLQESANVCAQVCDALQYALSLGYLHMDLHPFNIMINDQSQVVIVDLASFFTYDELLNQGFREAGKKETEEEKSTDDKKLCKGDRIRQFLNQNPALFQKGEGDQKQPEVDSRFQNFMDSMYFDRITQACVEIIMKSNATREQKLAKNAEIKKIAWNYMEDIQDDIDIPFDEYINSLIETLRS